jgi:hypothetical protein
LGGKLRNVSKEQKDVMKKTNNNLSALFRSLGPDETGLEAIAKATAPKVEKEWPLFKAVPPVEQQPTPPLSPQERKIWSKQAKVKTEVPRPTLSMSGLSSKLAKSLGQISEQMAVEERDMDVAPPEKQPRVGALAHNKRDSLSERASSPSNALFAKPSPAVELPQQEKESHKVGLLERAASQPVLAQEKARTKPLAKTQEAAESDDRLANIFSRLEEKEKEKVAVKPVEKRSSLSKRMGKR